MGTTVKGEEGGSGSTCGNDTYGYRGQRGSPEGCSPGSLSVPDPHTAGPSTSPAGTAPAPYLVSTPRGVAGSAKWERPPRPRPRPAPLRVPERQLGRRGRAQAGRAGYSPARRLPAAGDVTELQEAVGCSDWSPEDPQRVQFEDGKPREIPLLSTLSPSTSPPPPLPLQSGPRSLLRHPEMLWDTLSTLRSPASPPGLLCLSWVLLHPLPRDPFLSLLGLPLGFTQHPPSACPKPSPEKCSHPSPLPSFLCPVTPHFPFEFISTGAALISPRSPFLPTGTSTLPQGALFFLGSHLSRAHSSLS